MGSTSSWRRPVWQDDYQERKEREEREKSDNKDIVDEKPDEKPTDNEEKLAKLYQNMRIVAHQLEELIENGEGFTEKELHRLDKSIVVQKVGFKMVKKILAKRGYSGLKRAAFRDMLGVIETHTVS